MMSSLVSTQMYPTRVSNLDPIVSLFCHQRTRMLKNL